MRFFDVPGIESWDENNIKTFLSNLNERTKPIVAFIMVNPSCYANLESFYNIVLSINNSKMKLCFVMTNMYAGSVEQKNEMWNQLVLLAKRIATGNLESSKDILKWDNCLVTKINTIPYKHQKPNGKIKIYPVRGVDELIISTFSILTEDEVKGWCLAIIDNRTFWDKADHKLRGFISET